MLSMASVSRGRRMLALAPHPRLGRLQGIFLHRKQSSAVTAEALSSARSAEPPLPVSVLRSIPESGLHSYNQNPVLHRMGPSQIVVLPEIKPEGPRESGKFASHQLPEQLAVMYACLETGELERARRIFLALQKHNAEDMAVLGDIRMHNSFIEAFLNAKPNPRTKETLKWFESLQKYNVQPDLNTFCILIKGFLRMESTHTAKVLVLEMQKAGFSIEELRSSPNLLASDLEQIDTVVRLLRPDTATLSPTPSNNPTPEELATSEFAEVNSVKNSKNEVVIGVQLMKNTLDALSRKDLDRYERQLSLEERSYQAAIEKLEYEQGTMPEANKLNVRPLKSYLWQWHQALVASIKDELDRIDNVLDRRTVLDEAGLDKDRMVYGPFLKMLSPQKLSVITIMELLRLNNSGGIIEGMKSARALIGIGKAIESEYNAEQMKKKSNSELFTHRQNVHQLYGSGRLFNMAVRKVQTKKEEARIPTSWVPLWPESTRAKVGSVLTTLLMDCAKVKVPSYDPETNEKIIEELPAFFHTYQYLKGQRVGVIKVHNNISEILAKEPVGAVIHPRLLPMLVHPRPWLTFNNGGYLSTQSTIMRIRACPQQYAYLKKAHEEGLLFRVYNGLDVLGRTRWAINKRVLATVLEAWNTGEAFGKVPAAMGDVEDLPKPSDYDTSTKARSRWMFENRKVKQDAKNHHSLRCDVNYKIEIARAFADEPMYFPHNLDFRGRAYPIPPLFNHLGNDLCRGLLRFDEAKPLGDKGFTWLKIHLANLAGFDKHSLSARAQFTMDNLDHIFDSADNPMDGERWWLKAEDPWQCLATCIEVADAIRSGDPASFMSTIPIHQDGTCNGLQHYAALGGDMAGAQQVNLVPSDSPQDVYSGVARVVERLLETEAEAGVEAAKILSGRVTRKIVKQTVMTNVYGVTFIGARLQIESRLKETPGIPQDQVRALSTYLTKQVFASLGEMFTGARAIQDWLGECAKRIAKSVPPLTPNLEEDELLDKVKGRLPKTKTKKSNASQQMTSVIWTTPLNLPIVQPYRKLEQKQVKTNLQSITIKDPERASPVNVQKQRTAFPPNFIHSLDATHMLMSAAGCVEQGLTFASVHDSYWTHAKDVEVMNEVLRNQFILLHTNDIMENLRNEFIERYKDYQYPVSLAIVGPGEPVGEGMIAWDDERLSKKKADGSLTLDDPAFLNDPNPIKDEPLLDDDEVSGHGLGAMMEDGKSKSPTESVTKKALKKLQLEDDEDDEHDLEGMVLDEDEEEIEAEARALARALKKKMPKKTARKYLHTWVPISFPPLPAKGEFDVRKVAESDYFFS